MVGSQIPPNLIVLLCPYCSARTTVERCGEIPLEATEIWQPCKTCEPPDGGGALFIGEDDQKYIVFPPDKPTLIM